MDENQIKMAFARTLAEMPPQRRIGTLALLAHNMTIEVRWSRSEQPNDAGALTKLYALNEAMHRITARVVALAAEEDRWREDDFVDALFEFARQGGSEPELARAINYTMSAA